MLNSKQNIKLLFEFKKQKFYLIYIKKLYFFQWNELKCFCFLYILNRISDSGFNNYNIIYVAFCIVVNYLNYSI